MKTNKKIKPVWVDYRNWECYQNGMYENGHNREIIKQCYEILTNNNLKEAFIDKEFSKSWEDFEHKHFDENGEYIEEE